MSNSNRFSTAGSKLIKALIIGISCFFFGLLLATLSPLITIVSLLHKPKKKTNLSENWAKNIKKVEDKIKEIRDPDFKEDWKKRHFELYGNSDDPTDPEIQEN
jgi:hypothetical protein